jgi:hypothetical protein
VLGVQAPWSAHVPPPSDDVEVSGAEASGTPIASGITPESGAALSASVSAPPSAPPSTPTSTLASPPASVDVSAAAESEVASTAASSPPSLPASACASRCARSKSTPSRSLQPVAPIAGTSASTHAASALERRPSTRDLLMCTSWEWRGDAITEA